MSSSSSYLTTLRESITTNLLALETHLTATNTPHPHLLSPTPYHPLDDPTHLPSPELFTLLSHLHLDLTALTALLTPTRFALITHGTLPHKTACLHAAVTLDVASAIDELGGSASLSDLAAHCGNGSVNAHKLGRVLRVLAADFIFVETAQDVFANTRHSIALSGEGGSARGARSFLRFIGGLGMRCAGGITDDLVGEETGDSFEEATAPFSRVPGPAGKGLGAAGDGRTFAEVMADPEDREMVELGGEGVVGWLNTLTRESLLRDYPWAELEAEGVTVVDLGAGMGDSGMDILRRFGGLTWIYQDLPPVIEALKKNYPADLQPKVADGTISFVAQDYFEPNTSDAQVWYMRGVLHEYDDPRALHLLSHITAAMRRTPHSKLLINEVLNSSAAIIPRTSSSSCTSTSPSSSTDDVEHEPPSAYIPPQQSALPVTANAMTWSTFALFGGKERSYGEYVDLLGKAGLRVERMWQFRTFTVMLEAVFV